MSRPRFRSAQARETAALARKLGYAVEINGMGHLRCVHEQTGEIVICASKAGWHATRHDRSRLMKRVPADE